MNRLHLDFGLSTDTERAEFVKQYLERDEFKKRPPSDAELETIANYVLWGKNPLTGKNFVQEKLGTIETRKKTWAPDPIESLDELLESPTFNEASLLLPTTTKKVREVFSRTEARAQCPSHLLPTLEDLFRRIDVLDLKICYYDAAHSKRTKEIRQSLLDKFSEEERIQFEEEALHWNQYYYLKQKHELVELRREQFAIRDSFAVTIQRHTLPIVSYDVENQHVDFDVDIQVLPLGLYHDLLFKKLEDLNPFTYTAAELKSVSDEYWQFKEKKLGEGERYFDFRNKEHLYELFLNYFDIEGQFNEKPSVMRTSDKLLKTLKYYVDCADLDEVHRVILEKKMAHETNQNIADFLHKNYGKTYSANYISTIFRQRILPKICAAAEMHEKIVGNLFFEENFKKCTCCGKWLLRTGDNFVKKTRSPDGLNTRCKKCDKIAREKKKGSK